MGLQAIASLSVVGGVRLLLTTTSPLQPLLDKPGITHEFCNRQAVTILAQDGFTRCADFFRNVTAELNAGVLWADQGWKNVNHYFEPETRTGLWQFSTAIDEFGRYYSQAMRNMRHHDLRKASFYLGAAAHLLQDLCVPHHARGKVFSGHKQYEEWARDHHEMFAVNAGGLYNEGLPTKTLLLNNAAVGADLFDWVKSEGDAQYLRTSALVLPLAQRATAGLFLRFYTNMYDYTNARTVSSVA